MKDLDEMYERRLYEKMNIDMEQEELRFYSERLRFRAASRPLGNAVLWLGSAWTLFREYWWNWLLMGLTVAAIQILIFWGLLFTVGPRGGAFFVLILVISQYSLFYTVWMQVHRQQPPSLRYLRAAHQEMWDSDNSGALGLVCCLPILLLIGWIIWTGCSDSSMRCEGEHMAGWWLLLAVSFAMLWFVPVFIFVQGEGILRSILFSVETVVFNFLPMLLFFMGYMAVAALIVFPMAHIPTGSGIVLLSLVLTLIGGLLQVWTVLCSYAAYQDIWFDEA